MRVRPLRHRLQPIRGVVGVGACAVAEQVAVVVPRLGDTINAGETVRIVVNVIGDDRRTACAGANGLCQPVAGGIVAVLEGFAVAIVRGGQAVERVVAIVDRRGGRALRWGKGEEGTVMC